MKKTVRGTRVALAVWITAALWSASHEASAQSWQAVSNEAGIRVTTRAVPGRSLPVFRGVGLVKANVYLTLAVISDVERHCQWRPSCDGARIVERTGERELVMWSRNDAPWPVSDRDVVVKAKVSVEASKNVFWSRFKRITHPKAPPIDGVVRVPHIVGFYKLERLGPQRTRVTYQVNADPGGMIPDWLAARVSRNLPHKTIAGLRKQVVRRRDKYNAFITKWRAAIEPREESKARPQPAPKPAP